MPTNPVVISTWKHGLEANKYAAKLISKKEKAIDVVEQGVRVTEADPKVRTVGYGGYTDSDGNVTLDAAIMDHQNNAGAVSYLENIKHPISVARKVMEESEHVMLSGNGAYNFAIKHGFKHENILTEESKKDFLKWKEGKIKDIPTDENHDTITQLALDVYGNLAAACTTSGLAYKLNGRVGDSPIVGSGLFVDNNIGAAGGTGAGEEIMKSVGSFLIVELMRQGYSPLKACEEAILRIIKKHKKGNNSQVAFIALRKDGEFGAAAINNGFSYILYNKIIDNTVYDIKGIKKNKK